jgi:hypothetical protein
VKRPTIAEINARNRRRAEYRRRLVERLCGSGGPIQITPEIERALNTPVNELPVDQVILGAFRRAGTVDLAHPQVRLAKMRQKKRQVEVAHRAEGGKRSAEKRAQKNVGRDRRIHDARDKQVKIETIASAERVHHSTVIRVLKKPRP